MRFPSVDIYVRPSSRCTNRVAGRDERMLMKLVVDAETDRVLGFHVVGTGRRRDGAARSESRVKMRATKADFDATMAVHPTQSEEIVTMRKPVERHRAIRPRARRQPEPVK